VADLLVGDDLVKIRRKIQSGLDDRKKYEALWEECLAFASGRQVRWVTTRGGRRVLASEPAKPGVERYTVDLLAQYRQTVHGELSLDDDRPQLLFRHDDLPSEDYAEQANDAVSYGWNYEWDADRALRVVRYHLIDVGTAAVRCYFDPTKGPVKTAVPVFQGQPVYDTRQAYRILDEGGDLEIADVHEGRVRWQPGSAFNLIVPPGIPHEKDFPWECWDDVVEVSTVEEMFGVKVKPDAVAPRTSVQPEDTNPDGQRGRPKLDDHAYLRVFFERPNGDHPEGRTVWLVGADMSPVQVDPQLPYLAPDGTRRSGIHYFHYIRLSDRFWSRSMMELGLQPARAYSKRRTQIGAIYDRGQPKVIAEEGALKKPPSGIPAEVLWLKPGKPRPDTWAGLTPSQGMYQELESLKQDLEQAIGLRVALGENPENVGTYSQLALLRETETRKLNTTVDEARMVVSHLVEDSVYDIGRYWGREKQVAIAGTDGALKAFSFDASQLQTVFYRVEGAKGSAKPRTQAARLQLIQDLWQASLASGAVRLDPIRWLNWLKESYDQGQPIELPSTPPDYQQTFAEYAKQMLAMGVLPPMLDFVSPDVLVPAVREVEVQATLANNEQVVQACRGYLAVLMAAQQKNLLQQMLERAPQQAAQQAVGAQVQLAASQGAPSNGSTLPRSS